MVDEKTVRLVIDLAVLPQLLAHRLAFLAGVRKNKALFPSGMLENIADARIGGLRGDIGFFLFRRVPAGISFPSLAWGALL